jgi:DNA-binding NtrC family response regulator
VKRILFVDDESEGLAGLRTRLHRLHAKWEMKFVESDTEAIERMQERPYDVIVTDMRMPGMDGAKLLEIVSERWPQTVRIVLSGYADLQQTVRLVPVAHQYLSKPCQPQQLENVIGAGLDLEKLQQHVHCVAAAANALASRTPICDDTLLAGLLVRRVAETTASVEVAA